MAGIAFAAGGEGQFSFVCCAIGSSGVDPGCVISQFFDFSTSYFVIDYLINVLIVKFPQ